MTRSDPRADLRADVDRDDMHEYLQLN